MSSLFDTLRTLGVTYRQVHAAGGPSPAALSRVRRGLRSWKPGELDAIARAAGLPVDELPADPTPPPPDPIAPRAPMASKVMHLPPPDDVLTLPEAAAFLKCSADWLYSNKALLPPARLGGRLRYFRGDLVAFLRRSITG